MNCQSVCNNKAVYIHDHILDEGYVLMRLIETWLSPELVDVVTVVTLSSLQPLPHSPSRQGRADGLDFVCLDFYIKLQPDYDFSSFFHPLK